MKPLVSIIVPIYNTQKYIRTCVESLCTQTLRNIEVILVNDGSTDDCPNIIEELAKQDSRIKAIHKKNGGLFSARNEGLKHATGKYIGFVDSDDWVDKTMLDKLFNKAEKYSCEIVRCGYYNYLDGEAIQKDFNPIREGLYTHEQIINDIIPSMLGKSPKIQNKNDTVFGSVCLCIFLKEFMDNNNLRFDNTKMYEDVIFCINSFVLATSVVCFNEPLYYYRSNNSSLQNSYNPNKWDIGLYLYNKKKHFVKEHNLLNDCSDRVALNLISIARMAIVNECVPANKNGYKSKIMNIKVICNHEEVRHSINSIYKFRLGKRFRLTVFLMKFKLVYIIYAIYKLRYWKG